MERGSFPSAGSVKVRERQCRRRWWWWWWATDRRHLSRRVGERSPQELTNEEEAGNGYMPHWELEVEVEVEVEDWT